MNTIEIMYCGEISCEDCSKDKCIYMTDSETENKTESEKLKMGCIAEIVYGTVECNGNCDSCHWWDEPESEDDD